MNTHLFIMSLPEREDRRIHLKEQLKEQNITDYTIVPGIKDPMFVFRGVSEAHKMCVRMAMSKGYDRAIIAEDDICFTSKGSWQYFLDNVPDKYSLYLSMIYEGKIDENNRIVESHNSFSGMTLYMVHNSFYHDFLNINPMDNIDRALGLLCGKFEYYVCPEFICKQMDGYSDNKKQNCKYDHLLEGRKLYGS